MEQVKQSDEEFVRGVWANTETGALGFLLHMNHWERTDEMWSAAAAFTRERLEDVRQLQRDTAGCRGTVANLSEMAAHRIDKGEGSRVAFTVRALCSACRILSRLESILADKTAGMKEGA